MPQHRMQALHPTGGSRHGRPYHHRHMVNRLTPPVTRNQMR
jgi:hypothetical protein